MIKKGKLRDDTGKPASQSDRSREDEILEINLSMKNIKSEKGATRSANLRFCSNRSQIPPTKKEKKEKQRTIYRKLEN